MPDDDLLDRIGALDRDEQLRLMEEWFREHYEDPAERTPYESAEGGYIYIWGGPCDPQEELEQKFGGVVDDDVITELAEKLSDQMPEWAPIPSEDDYDHSLFDVVTANADAVATFDSTIETIRKLAGTPTLPEAGSAMYHMLFAHTITALETYLSDTFVNTVLREDQLLRKFFQTTPEFRDRTVRLSEIFDRVADARDEAKKFLLDVVWHNLAKVFAMYRDTLGFNFGSAMKEVARAIPTRHDIVHRNGRRKDGTFVTVGAAEVAALVDHVSELVHHVEQQYTTRALLDGKEPEF